MSFYLTKLKSGVFSPTYPSDHDKAVKVVIGGEVRATEARNPKHHRKGMALLNLGFENQTQYDSFNIYRKVVSIKAGYFEWVKGKDGKPYPIPDSISFDNMRQTRFNDYYKDILEVISKQLELSEKEVQAELNGFY